MHASVQIGPYQVLRLIKSGGQGRVYLAYDTRLQRKVALKLLPLFHGARARNAQLQEARIVASIRSERIVEIYDRVVSRNMLALVMEYVPGCDLEELLGVGGLPVSCALAIAADVTGALAVVRQADIVHGDLKASNILIGRHGRAKLTDFGIAASTHSSVGGAGAGSMSALAPEQIRGEPTDVRTDMFALGCLIYRMLTGQHPFVVQGRLDVDAIVAGQYLEIGRVLTEAEASTVPAGLVSLVEDLLQVSAERRPQNTHEVRRRLRDVSRSLPLALHASVADVAAPFFRAETADELPPDIPLELIEKGRSHGRVNATRLQKPVRHLLTHGSLALTVILLAALVWAWWSGAVVNSTRDIEIMEPELVADDATQSVLRVYPHAIRTAIATGVREESIGVVLGATDNDIKHTALSASLPSQVPVADERIMSRIECRSQLCLLRLQRVMDNASEQPATSFQVAMFADASPESWHTAIKQGVRALYAL